MEGQTANTIGITTTRHMKILGVYFSKDLRWNRHIKHTTEKVAPILNLTKMLAARNSHVPPKSLRKIASTLLFGTCSFGISLYGNAPETAKAPLVRMINGVLRTSIGALRSTPIPSLMVEAGFNLHNLATDLNISLVARNIVNSNAPHHNTISKYLDTPVRPRFPSSLYLALEKYLGLGGPVPSCDSIPRIDFPNTDPLQRCRLEIFPGMRKDGAPREAWVARYLEWRESQPQDRLIFTDASADNRTAAAAAVSYHLGQYRDMFRTRLAGDTSASVAEIFAIWEVIRRIGGEGVSTAVLTDSRASVNAIFNPTNRKYMPMFIRTILRRNAGRIKIGWVPGHVGIEGNEKADELAKRDEGGNSLELPPSEVYCRRRAAEEELRERTINWTRHNTFLGSHWTTPIPPNLNPRLGKTQARILTRLRMGHVRLNIEYHWTYEEPPQCSVCEVRANSLHYLTECRKTRTFFGGEIPSLESLLDPLQEADSPLFNLLRHLGIMYSI